MCDLEDNRQTIPGDEPCSMTGRQPVGEGGIHDHCSGPACLSDLVVSGDAADVGSALGRERSWSPAKGGVRNMCGRAGSPTGTQEGGRAMSELSCSCTKDSAAGKPGQWG